MTVLVITETAATDVDDLVICSRAGGSELDAPTR